MFYDRKRKDTHKSSSCDGGPPVRHVCNARPRKRYCSRAEGAPFRMYTDWQWPTRTQSCRLSRPSSHFSSARAFQATTSVCYLAKLANWNWAGCDLRASFFTKSVSSERQASATCLQKTGSETGFSGSKSRQVTGQRFSGQNLRQKSRFLRQRQDSWQDLRQSI